MNQDYNNFNQNNINMGNNGIPNNQPLNNTYTQQPVNNMYQQPVQPVQPVPTPQPVQPVPTPQPVQPQPVQPVQPVQQPVQPVPTPQPTYQQPQYNNYQQQTPKSKGPIIGLIIGIIVVIAIVGGVLFFMNNNDSEGSSENKNSHENNNSNNNSSTKKVGDATRGYVEIPSNWSEFIDVDGNSSIQYSYANSYIISLDAVESSFTAKEAATNFMNIMLSDNEVTDVNGATLKIGKNQEYTAYQVSMYYPEDEVYLITYWFDAGDGRVHYIALEGPMGVTEYLSIPESFSLTK